MRRALSSSRAASVAALVATKRGLGLHERIGKVKALGGRTALHMCGGVHCNRTGILHYR